MRMADLRCLHAMYICGRRDWDNVGLVAETLEQLFGARLETLVGEAIDNGIDGTVRVADQLQDAHGDPHRVAVLFKSVDQCDGEKRKPADAKHRHDHHHRLDQSLLLFRLVFVESGICKSVADWLTYPESMSDGSVRH